MVSENGTSTRRRWGVVLAAAFALCAFLAVAAHAATRLDNKFDGDGTFVLDVGGGGGDDVGQFTIANENQKQMYLVSSGDPDNDGDSDVVLTRYNQKSGVVDASYGTGGTLVVDLGGLDRDDNPTGGILIDQGRLVVVGSSDGDFFLARFTKAGLPDANFGGGDGVVFQNLGGSDDVPVGVLRNRGGFILGGYSNAGTDYDFAAARFFDNGNLDVGWDGDGMLFHDMGGDGGNDIAYAMAASGGRFYLGGYTDVGAETDFALVRYQSNGAPDLTFGLKIQDMGGVSDEIHGLAVQGNGHVFAVGNVQNLLDDSDIGIVHWMNNGTFDNKFGGGDGIQVTDLGTNTEDIVNYAEYGPGGRVWTVGSIDDNASFVLFDIKGPLDRKFSDDGIFTVDFGGSSEAFNGVTFHGKKAVANGTTNVDTDFDVAAAQIWMK